MAQQAASPNTRFESLKKENARQVIENASLIPSMSSKEGSDVASIKVTVFDGVS